MNIQFPLHTAIWIVLNMGVLGVLVVYSFHQSLSRLEISPALKRRWLVTVIVSLIAWFVIRLVLAHGRIVGPARLVQLSQIVVCSAVGLATALSSIFRRAVLSIPQEKLIGFQVVRVAGFVFLALLDMGLLPAQFALPAGYGDIIAGLTAPLALYALNHSKRYGRGLAIAWNLFGLLDFAVALATGMLFIAPHVRHLAQTGHSIAYLDYVLMIPGFAVPILILMHIDSLHGLRKRKEA